MPLSPTLIALCARAANAVYLPGEAMGAELRAAGLDQVAVEEVVQTDGKAVLAHDAEGDFDILAYRGTRSWKNAWIDAQIALERYRFVDHARSAWVHAGGLRSWLALANWSRRVVRTGRRLVVTGHSLGAWIARYASLDVGRHGALVTFGCPRPGDHSFADLARAAAVPHARVVHHLDIVPTAPAWWPWRRYQHVEPALRLDDDGRVIRPWRGRWRDLLHGGEQLVADLDGKAELDHHALTYDTLTAAYRARSAAPLLRAA